MATFPTEIDIADIVGTPTYIPIESFSLGIYDLIIQITYDSLDAAIQVDPLQSNENDSSVAQPILDSSEAVISYSITTPTDTDFKIINTFYGKWGFLKLDPLTATVGTIKFVVRWNGEQTVELT